MASGADGAWTPSDAVGRRDREASTECVARVRPLALRTSGRTACWKCGVSRRGRAGVARRGGPPGAGAQAPVKPQARAVAGSHAPGPPPIEIRRRGAHRAAPRMCEHLLNRCFHAADVSKQCSNSARRIPLHRTGRSKEVGKSLKQGSTTFLQGYLWSSFRAPAVKFCQTWQRMANLSPCRSWSNSPNTGPIIGHPFAQFGRI